MEHDMNLFTDFEQRLNERLLTIAAIAEKRDALDFSRLVVEPPRDPSHGARDGGGERVWPFLPNE